MIKRLTLLFVFVIAVFIFNAFINPIQKRIFDKSTKPQYGVSYSFEQAAWYGVDPRGGFSDLVKNYKFDWIRLSFFWDTPSTDSTKLTAIAPLRTDSSPSSSVVGSEPDTAGQIALGNLDELKWAVEEAGKHNIKVVIALGAKTPYFPEYHLPKNIKVQLTFGQIIDKNSSVAGDILNVDKQLVELLARYDNIAYWQVENEPLTRNINYWKIDPGLVRQEVDIVRSADPKKRPIILNSASVGLGSGQARDLLAILKPGDVFAVNAYFKTQGVYLLDSSYFGRQVRINWPKGFYWPVQSWLFLSPDYQKAKKMAEAKGVDFWVLEMQAEPYIRVIEDADEANYAFEPADIKKGADFLRSFDVKSIGFWGANFWQHREKNGDRVWADSVKLIVNSKR